MKRLLVAALLVTAPASAQQPVAPPKPAVPVPAAPAPAAKKPTEALLNQLRAAPTEDAAGTVEAQLRAAWADAASPAIKLLLTRGMRELSEGASSDSYDSYDAALDLDPELLDAWRGRASARLHMGDTAGAVRDLQEVIKREPRNFAAWQDLSRIAEARGDWRGALAAWQKMLDVDPHSPGGQARLKDLRRRALGEDA